ncbi:MAG TPA: hypothetical protein PL037_04090, partial [Elusimicrobiales bacterium]|nr:hypothetical protein [Elusimicrobiales bacterium]
MARRKIEKTLKGLAGKPDITVRFARTQDMRRIQILYGEVYGGSYSISLVTDREKMRYAIENDSYYWMVAECEGRIIGSLVYSLDGSDRISKAFGAVVSSEFRKLDLAHTMMELVLEDITRPGGPVDVVYATIRTASYAP